MKINTLELYRGERKIWSFVVLDSDGNPEDISNGLFRFTIRRSVPAGTITDDTDGEVLVTKTHADGVVITDATNGKGEIRLDKTDTYAENILALIHYYYGFEYAPEGETDYRVLSQGRLELAPDIARGS